MQGNTSVNKWDSKEIQEGYKGIQLEYNKGQREYKGIQEGYKGIQLEYNDCCREYKSIALWYLHVVGSEVTQFNAHLNIGHSLLPYPVGCVGPPQQPLQLTTDPVECAGDR